MGKNIEWADLETLMDEFEFETVEGLRSYIYYLQGVKEDYEILKRKIRILNAEIDKLY